MEIDQKGVVFEDYKINIKLKLSALWIAVMFCYVYGDILGFYIPGLIKEIIAGNMGFMGPTTQIKLFFGIILMAIPSVMIFLSLVLKPMVNRRLNIVFGIFYSLVIIVTMFMGPWFYYIFIGSTEIVLTSLITWFAYKWPKA